MLPSPGRLAELEALHEEQRGRAARRESDARLQREVEALFQLHVNGVAEAPRVRTGCLGRFVCPVRLFGPRRVSLFGHQRVVEVADAGQQEQRELPAEAKLEAAASMIQSRVDELGKKQAASRARAIELSAGGRRADALREMRRLKGIEAQQAAAVAPK